MAGLVADLTVAARLLARATARRVRGERRPSPDLDAFRASIEPRLDTAPPDVIRDFAWLDLPADTAPWQDSGVTAKAGDEVSYFMAGEVVVNSPLDLRFDPSLQVWCRAGDYGEVFRGTRSSNSFTVRSAGPICFGNYFPSTWKNRSGDLATGKDVYKANQGAFRILVIAWHGSAQEGLRALLSAGEEPHLAAELARIEAGDGTPEGWQYLWHLGPAEIFREGHTDGEGKPCIHCRTHRDVGILQRDVDLALTPESEISWRWCVDALPSVLREDTVPSHDYLSIAVEFDNGRDITYYWSATLPEDYGYDCPLPNWTGIEYHVVRSGTEQLGEWLSERRNLYDDYKRYMGDPPARITRVWFIAVSIFQNGEGRCDYADICLHGPEGSTRLL